MSNIRKLSIVAISVILVILGGILNKACEFEPEGTYVEEVPEPEGEIPSAELNFNDSVLYMDEATLFEYSLSFMKQEVYEVDFYIDDNKIAIIEDSTGSVLVDPLPGMHMFEMVVYTSTGSGSIADRVGAEVFTYRQSWTIYSEKDDIGHIQITTIGKADGGLRIEWDRYPGYFFESYGLYKNTIEGVVQLFETSDVDITSFSDPYFVGGSAEYYVLFHKTNGKEYTSDIRSYTFHPDTIELASDWEQQNLTVTWPRCAFEANFGSYSLSQSLNDGPYEVIYTTTALEDTTITMTVGENQLFQFELTYYSKMPDNATGNGILAINSEHIFTGPYYLPKPFPGFEVIAQSETPPYRIYTPEYFYDVVDDNLIYRSLAEHNGLFDVSDDNYRHISGLSHYHGDGEGWVFFWLDKELSQVPLSVFDNEERRACISHNSFLIIESGSSAYYYDMMGDSIIVQYDNDSLYWAVLSPQGHYIVAADKTSNEIDIYYLFSSKIGGKYYWFIDWAKSLPGTPGNYVFKNYTDFAMIWDSKLEIRSCVEMRPENGNGDGLLLSAATSATRVVETDPISNTLLACSSDSLFVYDLSDLRLLGSVPNTTVYQKVIQRGPQQVAYLNSSVFFMEEGATESTMQPLPIDKWR